jgi:membrane protease YdiL (CAAX protease family)
MLLLLMFIIAVSTGFIDSYHLGNIFIRYPILNGILEFLAIGSIVIWGYKKTKTPFQKIFPFRSVSLSIFLPITLILVGLSFLLSDLDNLLRIALHSPVNPNSLIPRLIYGSNIWIALLVLVIIAPLTEEFLFRGLILNGFINNYSIKIAIWISSLLFAFFHLNLFQFPSALIFGVIFAWLVIKTKSLWSSLYGHALVNSIPIIIMRLLKLNIPGYTTSQFHHHIFMQPLWLDGIGIVFVSLGVWWLWPMIRRLECPLELLREHEQEETIMAMENSTEESTRPFVKHGLISLILGVVAILSILIGALLFNYLHYKTWIMIIASLIIMLGLLSCLVGIGFGIGGIIKKSKLTLAGIFTNGLYFLFALLVVIFGCKK